jgi:serine protease Do
MKVNNQIKTLTIGLVGGLIPFSVFLVFSNGEPQETATSLPTHEQSTYAQRTSYSGASPIETESFVNAAESTLNSVVHVTTRVVKTTFQRDPFSEFFYGPGAGGREYKQFGQGAGSGVIISNDGYIVTNNHVIDQASEIEVTLNDNSKYTAKIVGADPSTDIAVLKIEGEKFQALPFGNSDDLRVGEWVLAVGNPFNLTSTVTAGIVSAKARNINLLVDRSKNSVPIESFIQTDAAVNPGNSGGALVNTRGELIGINTAIASQTGSYSGYSFAVPANLVQKVMRDLIDYGIVQRGFLGVQISDINQELKEANKLPNLNGVFVAKVIEGGSADKAKVKDGEVILKIGNKTVNSVAALQEEIGKRRPGDKISVTIREKDGDETIKEIVLRNQDGETNLVSKEEIARNFALGAVFEELSNKEKKELNIQNGVKIKTLNAGKLKSHGFQEGYIMAKINNEVITSVEQLTNKLNNTNGGVLIEYLTPSGRRDFEGLGL